MLVRVYHNGDDVYIAWKPDGLIPDCRGFALLRRRNGIEEVVSTWVGFETDTPTMPGERRASTNWPIQKYQWTDYMANPGDTLAYRVLPMVGPDKNNLHPDPSTASDWTPEVTLSHEESPRLEGLFNRGIVAAQWVSRRLGVTGTALQNKKLEQVIATTGDPFRDYLAGPLGARLFGLLDDAADQQRDIYAALFELDDPQLLAALTKLGQHAHVLLANGSVKHAGDDENHDARDALRDTVDLHDRMCAPRALGHNKFLVICDPDQKPRWVWTGSQNWTMTGLCTQANNSILIESPDLAADYRDHWQRLVDAGNATPDSLRTDNTKPRDHQVGDANLRVWFTPTHDQADLADARALIKQAEHAVLFLMCNPGPTDSLLNTILELAQAPHPATQLYIRGVLNQDPSTHAHPVHLFDHDTVEEADFDVVLPAAIDTATTFFREELKKLARAFAMVHSKVILVDPLGPNPVVITGSHNLGPKASSTNDENLLIIRGAPGLAAAYATNVMAIYNQYRWRFRLQVQPVDKRWKGLLDGDTWQKWYFAPDSARLREVNFWVGQ